MHAFTLPLSKFLIDFMNSFAMDFKIQILELQVGVNLEIYMCETV